MTLKYCFRGQESRAACEWLWREQKSAQRKNYYYNLLWGSMGLFLALEISVFTSQIIDVYLCLAIIGYYWFKNWSFEKKWNRQLDQQTAQTEKFDCILQVEEDGLINEFLGMRVFYGWAAIQKFTVTKERIMITGAQRYTIVIPVSDITEGEKEVLLSTLRNHQIKEEA